MNVLDSSAAAERLMVIIPDRISELIQKGEITERYYNPGEFFKEVHLVMVNDDHPDIANIQKTVGNAKLFIHNLPAGKKLFLISLGWRQSLLHKWAGKAVKLAQEIRPSLIRCHGAHLNAFAAHKIKAKLGIPYVVSLHINPDEDVRGRANGFLKRIVTHAQQDIEKIGLKNADFVMPVYKPIIPYLDRLGISHYEVCYNVLNPTLLRKKEDYTLHVPVRVISVGRQFNEKNPENLIRAISQLPNVELTMIGDGSHHDYLRKVAAECGIADKVVFHRALPNDELCSQLPDFDIFAVHSEYWELSKSVLEPLLTGLPVVINRRLGKPVPELTRDICMLVENSPDDYRKALECLIGNNAFRESLGRKAYEYAQAHWAPQITEAKFVDIYRRYMLRIV